MGMYDQAARRAMFLEPRAVLNRLLRQEMVRLEFDEWRDSRTTPRGGETDRTADKVATLKNLRKPSVKWAIVLEMQANADEDKLDVLLQEVARVRLELRHGPLAKEKYQVLPAFVFLRSQNQKWDLDMTLPSGIGIRHRPLVWDVPQDDARTALDALETDGTCWGLLFWVALMKNGNAADVIRRWLALVRQTSQDTQQDLVWIALVFAELAGCLKEWEKAMEQYLTDSPLINRWLAEGDQRGDLRRAREYILDLLDYRFPGQVSDELRQVINNEDSTTLLQTWHRASATVLSVAEFIQKLR